MTYLLKNINFNQKKIIINFMKLRKHNFLRIKRKNPGSHGVKQTLNMIPMTSAQKYVNFLDLQRKLLALFC